MNYDPREVEVPLRRKRKPPSRDDIIFTVMYLSSLGNSPKDIYYTKVLQLIMLSNEALGDLLKVKISEVESGEFSTYYPRVPQALLNYFIQLSAEKGCKFLLKMRGRSSYINYYNKIKRQCGYSGNRRRVVCFFRELLLK